MNVAESYRQGIESGVQVLISLSGNLTLSNNKIVDTEIKAYEDTTGAWIEVILHDATTLLSLHQLVLVC